jgi:hypothetical protein
MANYIFLRKLVLFFYTLIPSFINRLPKVMTGLWLYVIKSTFVQIQPVSFHTPTQSLPGIYCAQVTFLPISYAILLLINPVTASHNIKTTPMTKPPTTVPKHRPHQCSPAFSLRGPPTQNYLIARRYCFSRFYSDAKIKRHDKKHKSVESNRRGSSLDKRKILKDDTHTTCHVVLLKVPPSAGRLSPWSWKQ